MKKRITAMAGVMLVTALLMTSGTVWATGNSNHKIDDGTITDNGLVWLKNANCFGKQSWAAATFSARTLASGACGLKDGSTAGEWRLPTKSELQSMVSKKGKFQNIQDTYWSSTTSDKYDGDAYVVWMVSGASYINIPGNPDQYVWPVRAVKK